MPKLTCPTDAPNWAELLAAAEQLESAKPKTKHLRQRVEALRRAVDIAQRFSDEDGSITDGLPIRDPVVEALVKTSMFKAILGELRPSNAIHDINDL